MNDHGNTWKMLYEGANASAADFQVALTMANEKIRRLEQRAWVAESTLNDVMSESSVDDFLLKQLAQVADHVNSLPEGHYSPWLTHWARIARLLVQKMDITPSGS